MKTSRIILIILISSGLCGMLYAVNPRDINDTSNIRISSPELRAELLTNLMKRRLDLDNATAGQLKTINLKCEEFLQQLVIDNPAKAFSTGRASARGPDKFDQLAAQRADAFKQILKSKYSLFEREQFGLRNELKKQILAHNANLRVQDEAQKKAEAEAEEARKAADLAARQKAYQEQKALESQKTTVSSDKGATVKKKNATKKKKGTKKKGAKKKKK
jgi:hypothetical protein